MLDDTSISNFIVTGADSIHSAFTDLSTINSTGYSLLVKAKRYGRWWILKGLKEEYRNQSVYQTMLRKEFDIMIQLQHQNIVSVTGLEDVPDIGLCIIMEWIDGTTLKDWLRHNHSHNERLSISFQLMDALAYAHNLQIAHRNLKPSNVMVTHNG